MNILSLIENGKDGSLCPVRAGGLIFGALCTTVYFALSVWTVVHDHQPLDYVAFAGGASAIWGVVGACIAVKAKVEK